MRLSATLILFVLVAVCNAAYATQPVKLTGTFTDMRYSKESGDLIGHELHIVFTSAGYEGTYQIAEGEPSKLMLVDIKFQGNRISFSVSAGIYSGSFVGVIDSKGISGTFTYKSGATEKIDLLRGKSYWD